MIKNYFLVALRNIQRKPFYFTLNLTGLTVGISCCLIILLYVNFELSYDNFHSKKDRLYRVNYDITFGDNQTISPSVPVFVAPHLKRQFPEVEDATRFLPAYSSRTIRVGEKMFDESGFSFADSNFFKLLDFSVIHGNLSTALTRPRSVVITRTMAEKFFDGENPIGKSLLINNTKEYEVTAVIENVPANSYFTFDFVASLNSIEGLSEEIRWNDPNYVTFVLLHPNVDHKQVEAKIDRWVNPEATPGQASIHLPLESLRDAHFNTDVFNYRNTFAVTDFNYVVIFSVIAAVILVIAGINYVNLATARATSRAKEVGMRKAIGASFWQLLFQFLAESFVLLLPAIILSVLTVKGLIPFVQNMFGKPIPFNVWNTEFILILFGGWIMLSILSGIYPAFVLSSFRPVQVLKGKMVTGNAGGFSLRKGLVVFQFAISIILVVCTLFILGQLNYMQNEKLGLDKDQVVMIRGNSDLLKNRSAVINSFEEIPGVEEVALTWRSPFETVIGNGFSLKVQPEENDAWDIAGGIAGDENYLSALGMKLIAGKNFDPGKITNDTVINEFIVNETFVKKFGFSNENVIGKQIALGLVMNNGPGTIVGVVEDFHTASLHSKVEPVIIFNHPDYMSTFLVRLSAGTDVKKAMAQLESSWRTLSPQRPFNFTFLDDQYDAMYRTEERVSLLVSTFSGLAIFIACLGLVGLASFNAAQRAKEIGIRKVLGATTQSIVVLLSGGYVKLIMLSFVIAGPVSYYLVDLWLSNFVYRIDVNLLYFGIAAFMVVLIALLTVGYQSFKASVVNPSVTLKNE